MSTYPAQPLKSEPLVPSASTKSPKTDRRPTPHRKDAVAAGTDEPRPGASGIGYKELIFGLMVLAALAYTCEALGQPRFIYSESSYAQAAREMVQFNSMIVPLLREHHYYDKPILSYWLVIAGYKALGVSIFASRAYSIVCSLLTMLTVAVAGRRAFNPQAAVASVLCLATSMCFAQFAASSMPDMLLTLCDALALAFLYASIGKSKESIQDDRQDKAGSRRLWFVLACAAMALGFLTKGPIGLVLPSATFALYLLCTRQLKKLRISSILLGVLVFLAIVLPWHIAVYQVDGMLPIDLLYLKANLQAFVGGADVYNLNRNPIYMVRAFFTGFLPWSLFLPLALVKTAKTIRRQRSVTLAKNDSLSGSSVEIYLWLWIAVGLVFFSLSKFKWGYYNLPLLPAAALLTGSYVSQLWSSSDTLQRRIALFAGPTIFAASHALLLVLPLALNLSLQDCFLVPVTGAIGGCISTIFLLRKQRSSSLTAALTTLALVFCAYCLQIVPAQAKNDVPLVYGDLLSQVSKQADLVVHSDLCGQYQLFDPIYFKTGRQVKIMDSNFLRTTIESAKPAYIIVINDWYENQSKSMKTRLKIVDSKDFPFVNHPGSQYYRPGPENQVVKLMLLTTVK